MNTDTAKTAQEPHVPNNALVSDPKAIARLLRLDRFLVYWFNYSYLARMVSKANNLPPVPTLILITKGRKSGKWIQLPIYYFRDGANYVVIGSNGGAPKHTSWFMNLQADPDCKIHLRWRTYNMRARVATAEERVRIWENASKQFPNYNDYQVTAAPREIPAIVLEKR